MAEDFNLLKSINKRLVHAPLQRPWEFRLEISGMPKELGTRIKGVSNFDLLVKDINYGPVTIETDAIKAGSVTLTFPSGTDPTSLTMTVRDFRDRRLYRWIRDSWVPKVVNLNGTFNLPTQYVKSVRRVSLFDEDDVETWYCFPTKIGDITESVDGEGFYEFPVTMIQFRTQQWAGSDSNLQAPS